MPLRGRSGEVSTVLRALRAGRDGEPAVLIVSGEAGIGKSALLDTAVEQADRLGYTIGTAVARDGDRISPLSSLGPALRSGREPLIDADDFFGLAALTEQPLWLAERLASLLARRSEKDPLLVVVDDLQWSDPLSVFVLRLLPARLPAHRICWLFATRDLPDGPAATVADAVEATVPVHRIALAPLSGDAVLDIAADRLGHPAGTVLAQRLATAAGNPFLAAQIVEDPGDGGAADGLVDAVRRRLVPASQRCHLLLRAGAVLGERFSLADAAQLTGRTVADLGEAVDEAVRLGLLTDAGAVLSFRHDLLRQAVYQTIAPSVRWSMHRAFAEHCVTTGRSAAEAAPHVLTTASPGDRSAAALLRTAALDLLATMVITSITFIRHADALVADDRSLSPELGRDVVRVLSLARHHAEARDFADEILRDRPGTPVHVALVQLLLLPRLWAAGDRDQLARRAADERAAGAAAALRERLTAWSALTGAVPEAPGHQSADTPPDDRVDQPADAVAAAVTALGRAEQALAGHRYAEAAAGYRQARELTVGSEPGAPDPAQVEIREIASAARHDPQAARRTLASARHADSWHAAEYAWARADLEFGAGRLEAARLAAQESLAAMHDLGDPTFDGRVRAILVAVALERTSTAEAARHLAAVPRTSADLPVLRGLLALRDGDPAAAATLLRSSSSAPGSLWWDDVLVRVAVAAHRSGDTATLEAAARRLGRLAAANPSAAGPAGAAALAEGLLTGDPGRAVALLRTSGRELLLARAEEETGRAVLATDHDGALAVLDRALTGYEQLGSDAGAARVLRVLHRAGVRRRRRSAAEPRPETGWAALTGMERKVALLIADGHTNREAAARLVLSPNTVATHLRAAYRKLDVNSRVRLAARVHEATRHDP
ncbi:helix-turn-helix transcriptional regulator [Actinoplanes philippinensis]|uniref:Regulatory protein, luxR family n=2 Tax=Actinoplanes philippinensis TaxID=35752 RepID=A0A1I2HES2_9ACTN|nr:helix-turn-helix transcriptional regulator [Actinoplanes philippinensis]SFF28765.1 regulatory protein, luxR family [Actinoplanes philippinensis]